MGLKVLFGAHDTALTQTQTNKCCGSQVIALAKAALKLDCECLKVVITAVQDI